MNPDQKQLQYSNFQERLYTSAFFLTAKLYHVTYSKKTSKEASRKIIPKRYRSVQILVKIYQKEFRRKLFGEVQQILAKAVKLQIFSTNFLAQNQSLSDSYFARSPPLLVPLPNKGLSPQLETFFSLLFKWNYTRLEWSSII